MNLNNIIVKNTYRQKLLPFAADFQQFLIDDQTCTNKYFTIINLITESNVKWHFGEARSYFTNLLELANFPYTTVEKIWLVFYLALVSCKQGLDFEAQLIYNNYKLLPQLETEETFFLYVKMQIQSCMATVNLVVNAPESEIEANLNELSNYSNEVRQYINTV